MSPRQKQFIQVSMLHLYRTALMILIAFSTYMVKDIHDEIKSDTNDIRNLKEVNAANVEQHKQFNTEIVQLKADVKYLYASDDRFYLQMKKNK